MRGTGSPPSPDSPRSRSTRWPRWRLFRDAPASVEAAAAHASVLADNATTVGALLLLKAFASGCSALTGVEAIANAVPSFRAPAARRAMRAEVALGALLGVMLIGLSVLISRFGLQPVEGVTVLAQLADASLGHNWGFYVVQFATMVLLALSANTSFGGLPVLLKLLARDNYVPHVFGLKADRQVHRHGVVWLAVVSAALLVFSGGDTNTLSAYVRELARTEPGARVTVLIAETEPERLWQRLLQNQRGAVVAHAVRRDTDAVICRLRFRIAR